MDTLLLHHIGPTNQYLALSIDLGDPIFSDCGSVASLSVDVEYLDLFSYYS